jgi:hypothetical protein
VDVEVACPHCHGTLTVHVDLDEDAINAAVDRGVNDFAQALADMLAYNAG